MGDSYYGEPAGSLGNGRSAGSSSSSSRKGKKSNSAEKPKQPQRGLGVAQLEKIRLHHQMGSNYLPNTTCSNYQQTTHLSHQQEDVRMEAAAPLYSSLPSSSSSSPSSFGYLHHPNIMMGLREMEGTNIIRYGDSHSCPTPARWNHDNGISLEQPQYGAQPNMTRQLFSFQMEDSTQRKRRKDRCNLMGSSSSTQNSDPSDHQMQEGLDLELRL